MSIISQSREHCMQHSIIRKLKAQFPEDSLTECATNVAIGNLLVHNLSPLSTSSTNSVSKISINNRIAVNGVQKKLPIA